LTLGKEYEGHDEIEPAQIELAVNSFMREKMKAKIHQGLISKMLLPMAKSLEESEYKKNRKRRHAIQKSSSFKHTSTGGSAS